MFSFSLKSRVTPARVGVAVLTCWALSCGTGFVPVFTGAYTSMEYLERSRLNSEECADLVVNKWFGVLAGIVSFWLPGSIMVYVYFKVYQVTRRLRHEERRVTVNLGKKAFLNSARPSESNHNNSSMSSNSVSVKLQRQGSRLSAVLETENEVAATEQHRKRESGAAKTVGIVMGIFLACWLPFFIWMPLTAVFELYTPPIVYSGILWIGYGNSVVNPFVYGFFSREFRAVIAKTCR